MRRFFCSYKKVSGSGAANFTVPLSMDFEIQKIVIMENTAAINGGGVLVEIEQAGNGLKHNDSKKIPAAVLQAVKVEIGKSPFLGRSTNLKGIDIIGGDTISVIVDAGAISGAETHVCILGYKVTK